LTVYNPIITIAFGAFIRMPNISLHVTVLVTDETILPRYARIIMEYIIYWTKATFDKIRCALQIARIVYSVTRFFTARSACLVNKIWQIYSLN